MVSRKTYVEKPEIVFVEIHIQLFLKNNTGFDIDTKDDFEKLKN